MEYLLSYRDFIQNGIEPSWKDELYHYGIKGMHWGVRRYQNSDGTLTPAGRKRLAKQTYKADKRKAKQSIQDWEDRIDPYSKYRKAKKSAKYRYKQSLRDIKYGPMKTNKTDTAVTKRVKEDYRSMNDREFSNKYYTTKNTYARRVQKAKDGDPYRARINSRSYKMLRKMTQG